VELYSRIEQPSLHSKTLTDGTWSDAFVAGSVDP
jgi:hypothetical protein